MTESYKLAARFLDLDLAKKLKISFEFFPPKNEDASINFWESIPRLETLNPDFVSVTYGAGGSTREKTFRSCQAIIEKTNIKPASHLTCIGASKKDISEIAEKYWANGIRHILALRGDLPKGYTHPEDGYNSAPELITAL